MPNPAVLADVIADYDTIAATVANVSGVMDSAVTFVNLEKAQIADLSTQLAAAIANGNPADIQKVADGLVALNTVLTQKAADIAAAIATTPGATPPPSATVAVTPIGT